jgi:hypothetical protein
MEYLSDGRSVWRTDEQGRQEILDNRASPALGVPPHAHSFAQLLDLFVIGNFGPIRLIWSFAPLAENYALVGLFTELVEVTKYVRLGIETIAVPINFLNALIRNESCAHESHIGFLFPITEPQLLVIDDFQSLPR